MHKVYQTKFGGNDSLPETRGDCFPACLATILGMRLADVPHFYGTDAVTDDPEDSENWWAVAEWLSKRGIAIMPFDWPMHDDWCRILDGSMAIFTGPSPRFDDGTLHAVVGQINLDGGWRLLHDPYPGKTDGLNGDPTGVEVMLWKRRR